ncbi:hypothetical protein O181_041000 [Austropuccinia psidii MF-1]|uniref:Uncharacterized protein n=1 Tax=Austropuccinia psidii MF-1 TaxID=1389203 RepID=A0A9Q3DE54_9BASI|nr:hypothetical protein [Austropuccinia psidii MF-1]
MIKTVEAHYCAAHLELMDAVSFQTITNCWKHTAIYNNPEDLLPTVTQANDIPGVRKAIKEGHIQLNNLMDCNGFTESRPSNQMSIEHLLNPIPEQTNQDELSEMPPDEQLVFNTINPTTTNSDSKETSDNGNGFNNEAFN